MRNFFLDKKFFFLFFVNIFYLIYGKSYKMCDFLEYSGCSSDEEANENEKKHCC